MDKKVVLGFALWVSGFTAGVIFIARSLKIANTLSEPAPTDSAPVTAPTAPAGKLRHGVQQVTTPIALATKADMGRLRHAARSVNHRVISTIDSATGHKAQVTPDSPGLPLSS